jgi:hypothetical protein
MRSMIPLNRYLCRVHVVLKSSFHAKKSKHADSSGLGTELTALLKKCQKILVDMHNVTVHVRYDLRHTRPRPKKFNILGILRL